MKLNVEKWKQAINSDQGFDSTIDITNDFIHITIRCIENNCLASESISLDEMKKNELQNTSYIINKIEDMKTYISNN